MGGVFSVDRCVGDLDLVRAAKNELWFLRMVDKHKAFLYDPDSAYMKEAMRRYKRLWLPLIVEYYADGTKDDTLVGPLDVEWLSHTHRLSPTDYIKDLSNWGMTRPPPFRLLDPHKHLDAYNKAQDVWKKRYPEEPFIIGGAFEKMSRGVSSKRESKKGAAEETGEAKKGEGKGTKNGEVEEGKEKEKEEKEEEEKIGKEESKEKEDEEKPMANGVKEEKEDEPKKEENEEKAEVAAADPGVEKETGAAAKGDDVDGAVCSFLTKGDVTPDGAAAPIAAEATSGGAKGELELEYDLVEAVRRQQMFYYQVSLPHYRKSSFLKIAVSRYKQFLRLKQAYPNKFLVPCYDFDLIWHAHQQHAAEYVDHTLEYLGDVLSHDDSINDRTPGSKLNRGDALTRDLWKKEFGASFFREGSMWRGDPPHTWISRPPPVAAHSKSSNGSTTRVFNFFKGSFREVAASELGWAFVGLNVKPQPHCLLLVAVHDIIDYHGLQVLVVHSRAPPFSAVFVISKWIAGGPIPRIYACSHLVNFESLTSFDGPNTGQTYSLPMLLRNGKYGHQRRAMVVKGDDRDDSMMIGLWSGRRKGRPGSLEVVHYDLDPKLWGDDKRFTQWNFKQIATRFRVPNTLSFSLKGTTVCFNSAYVTFDKPLRPSEIVVRIATAFAVAVMQVLLQPRLTTGEIAIPDKKTQPNALESHDSEFLIMAGIQQKDHTPSSYYYVNSCGGCGACGTSCGGCGASCGGGGGGCGADGGGCGGCGGGCGGCG